MLSRKRISKQELQNKNFYKKIALGLNLVFIPNIGQELE